MKSAVKWMVSNHVAANLLMMVFVVGGIIMASSIKQEVFPEVTLDKIKVSVSYPGAGPEEVEEGIILKIEDNLTGVDGIKEINSVATEGLGTVTAELAKGENPDRILQEIKSEVDRIVTFPEDAEKPVVTKILNLREVISVVVYGDVTDRTLREQAESIREELLDFPGITQVDLGGVRPYEISVEIPEKNLRRYNLTLDQVAGIIRRASLDLPGGNIRTRGGEILLRTKEKRYRGTGYEEIVIVADRDGTQVRLGDIARVKDTFEETDLFARFDGKPAAMVKVYRVGDQKPTRISEIVNKYVMEKELSFPDSIHVAAWNDSSELLESRMNLLYKNACMGLFLVIIILGLFLEIRLALWVMLGIPISFMGALFILPMLDVSINMMSLFAFILALGILVDDAIVVGENIFEHRQKGKPFAQAALDGTLEVCVPVTFSILTTVAAFLPLAFISGTMGKFMKAIPMVVITLLLVSLVESLLVLPAHLSSGENGGKKKQGNLILRTLETVRVAFSRQLERFIRGPYNRLITFAIEHRYSTVAVALTLLLLSVGVIRGGFLKFTFMPDVDGDVITVALAMPPGTPVAETDRIGRMIVAKALETAGEIDGNRPGEAGIVRHIYRVAGGTIARGGPAGGQSTSAAHLSNVALLLTESEKRNYPVSAITGLLRKKVGEVPGADSLTFTSNLVRMGANIDIQMAHTDFSILEKVAQEIRDGIARYPGVTDIEDTYSRGKQELKLKLTPGARTLGITEEDLARQVRGAFYGSEALRLQIARNEVKVMVRYPEADRKNLQDLTTMRIRTPDGGEMPLPRAGVMIEGRGFSEINRTDRKRVINVTASVDNTRANAQEILGELKTGLLPGLSADYPGLTFDLVGEAKEKREVAGSMKEGFLLALFAIYALMAIPFRSYTQPLLIMTAIPFGAVGAIFGHLVMGYNLSMLSMFGLVALSGVVINDAILIIDKINVNRRSGQPIRAAVISAGVRRFRPILLTSLTTFFGLVPMILETSVQAQFLIPMAISLGFGILFSTLITLVLIPALYVVLEDFHALFAGKERTAVAEKMV